LRALPPGERPASTRWSREETIALEKAGRAYAPESDGGRAGRGSIRVGEEEGGRGESWEVRKAVAGWRRMSLRRVERGRDRDRRARRDVGRELVGW
jgi:hypothetical protein